MYILNYSNTKTEKDGEKKQSTNPVQTIKYSAQSAANYVKLVSEKKDSN